MLTRRKENMQMTVRRAKYIAKKLDSIELGVEKAMMIADLKEKLRNGVAKFAYFKKSGEVRLAYGTLDRKIIRELIIGTGKSQEQHHVCAYWDLIGGWRSFRWENLIAVY